MRDYPTCPKCGDLCGMLARICANCGTHLYEDVTPAGRRRLDPPEQPWLESATVRIRQNRRASLRPSPTQDPSPGGERVP